MCGKEYLDRERNNWRLKKTAKRAAAELVFLAIH
jgi:hypothetical protein